MHLLFNDNEVRSQKCNLNDPIFFLKNQRCEIVKSFKYQLKPLTIEYSEN